MKQALEKIKSSEFSTGSKPVANIATSHGGNSGTQKEPTRAKRTSHQSQIGGGRFLFENHKVIQGLHFYSFGLLKRLYLWVLSWAESKYGTIALAILAFMESSFFPIPPDVLQIALSIARPKRSFWYAFVSSVFSVLGGIFGYYIGYFLFETIGKAIIAGLGYQDYFMMVGDLFKENAFLAILAAAFTPIPYKVFTIAAGVWKIGLPVLILASAIGRPARFFLVAVFTYFMGERVKVFLERYFNWISLILFLTIFVGYIAIKYLI